MLAQGILEPTERGGRAPWIEHFRHVPTENALLDLLETIYPATVAASESTRWEFQSLAWPSN